MKHSGQTTVFGRRKEPHTVIIARGDDIRHFTVRPWILAFLGSALATIVIGYLLATSYLVLRDDLIGAMAARQARLQQAYEDRISALRAQVDRITSRQLLDQQLVETKVGELLQQQLQLSSRHGRLAPLLDRAAAAETPQPSAASSTDVKPEIRASLSDDGTTAPSMASAFAAPAPAKSSAFWSLLKSPQASETAADHADKLFASIKQSLKAIESEQLARINSLTENAYQTADAISEALESSGVQVDSDYGKSDVGGPLIAIENPNMFDARVQELDESLDRLDKMKETARRLPIANPAPGRPVSSTFGVRPDPILGTPALHSGMDFRAPSGSAARATAPGTVVKAGWNGGYGRMVEIDHGFGFSTRYAHLSRIDVKEGQKVSLGEVVGEVGTTGRSTGPHLHYEVRQNGEAVNPLRFLKLGKELGRYL
ncbi:murein DD-endopeptidase MepM/ murein hydrolase activator NlpD [Mesorhizobium soli]|uniref:M23 family metallopeptidase n=1 Tax=Pseudaminobacter soli (ex Li et al. 2025) TaxID=1295366 RepID=UPI002476722F|nr:M23 family metallopeptidase [Mesorhizobium soli]MDH6232838.1 murein DD-endopeptidase MepM/ murein hydrolase activator NlpD [Mesorhizobium soli]